MSAIISIFALASADAAQTSGGLPQMDVSTFASQLFWLAVTFSVLFFVMRNVILPRLGGIIEERKDRIADDLDQAGEFKQQAEAAEASYEQALGQARAKARNIAGETRKVIDQQITSMQNTMESELAEKVGEAEARITLMKDGARTKVRDAAMETTRAIVETLIEEVPTRESVEAALSTLAR